MARLLVFEFLRNSFASSRKHVVREIFLLYHEIICSYFFIKLYVLTLSWNYMLCVRIEAILMSTHNIQLLCRKFKRFP